MLLESSPLALILVAGFAAATLGCSALGTITGGYARPLSSNGSRGGPAFHAAIGYGSGAHGEGAGLGPHVRWKNTDYDRELAIGAHIYMLSMKVKDRSWIFTTTEHWGGYGRFGLNLIEFERYEGDDFVSTLGPSFDLGLLTPIGLTVGGSIERDLRFADHLDETFVFLMIGLGIGGVGPF